ncbi:molybdenum cofactor biosynthesis protein A [Denitrovibrio acetiphilus DSM 12809]|uniref:GTP 3',8-cyclase n=1 Tax=Denitrovibrio acetiphilus (strain DSM 12809 / NBRC 114555 / N2460) TaxID=522772 RepID=D4H3V1_DENA2|nr:GTP 3',8-cyclase MoaA [Denitrovibrio acetiphilus]ADD69203.1 molybdenum cofactor biosynthesis protein A [Denitrovibrio acetiphilus DSM 12809]
MMSTHNNMKDRFGREIKYLRVSVTDRCNFRCKYCMPTTDFKCLQHENILSYEELLFAVDVFCSLGVKKVRVTGGEPLVRKGIGSFLEGLGKMEKLEEVTLTTNGALLKEFTEQIKSAGIQRVNVSLDSLQEERYKDITGGFKLEKIIDSIKHVQRAGIGPVKTNMVVIKGYNDDEILDFCEFSAKNRIITRFIEFMPVGNFSEWKEENILFGKDILEIIKSKYDLKQTQKTRLGGPAQNYELSNGAMIGIITPISNHFCSECDKLRLTSDGKLRPCLLSDAEIDLVPSIKNQDRNALIEAIEEGLNIKDQEHKVLLEKRNDGYKRTMSKIGG